MKKRILEKHLHRNGCAFYHAGKEHDMWINLTTLVQDAVPRHKEIKTGTARSICKQLGIPLPPGK